VQFPKVVLQGCLVVLPSHPIDPRCGTALERQERLAEQIDGDMVQQCGELLLLPLPSSVAYAIQPR